MAMLSKTEEILFPPSSRDESPKRERETLQAAKEKQNLWAWFKRMHAMTAILAMQIQI